MTPTDQLDPRCRDDAPRGRCTLLASPPVAAIPSTRKAHAYLQLLERDERAAALEQLTRDVNIAVNGGERGDMDEIPDRHSRAPTLFRYTGFDGVQSMVAVPVGRLTPHIRALVWELAEAIEDEGRR